MKPRLSLAALLVSALILNACSDDRQTGGQASTPPPPPIEVVQAESRQILDWHAFTTRLESPEIVQLRPRINGQIDMVDFTEGSMVEADQVLFRLDPRRYQAQVDQLSAQLEQNQTALAQARREAKRAQELQQRQLFPQEQAEARLSTAQQLVAEQHALEASLAEAELQLSFTQVRSPLAGRVSRAIVTKGNTVAAGQSVLTQIVSMDPLYAYFDIDERAWFEQYAGEASLARIPVELELSGQAGQQLHGHIDFVDNQIDSNSGTLRLRAVFDNADQRLLPGAFGRVRLASPSQEAALFVPESAVGSDLSNKFVLVVDTQNTIQYRQVTLGKRFKQLRAITEGLMAGDTVVLNGPAKVRPGMLIQPTISSVMDEYFAQLESPPAIDALEVSQR